MIKFFLKRIPVLAVLTGILAFFLDALNLIAFATVIVGSALAMYKLILWNRAFGKLSLEPDGGSIKFSVMFVCVLVLTLAVMTAFAILNAKLLLCFSAGYLTFPAVVLINALTEGLNITKNNWGEKD